MKITTTTGKLKLQPDAVAVCLFDDEIKAPRLPMLDRSTSREVMKLITAAKFKGGKKEIVRHFTDRGTAPVIILHGLGSRKDFEWHTLRLVAGAVVRSARDAGAKSVVLISEEKLTDELPAEGVARSLVSGIILGNWRFDHYREVPKEDKKELKSVVIHFTTAVRKRAADRIIKTVRTIAECQNLAREYGTHPANVVDTNYLAREARKLSKQGIRVTVLDKTRMEALGMGLLLAVAQGSAMPPKLIVMDWNPRNSKKTIAFVGKGVVFDAGGLNLKLSSMEEMKSDMCGGGAVLAAMHGVAKLKPKCRVVGIIGAVENLTGANAYRPSDILTAMNGKTVEVMNTDAEGRLVLGDALTYAIRKYKPNGIVDVATLTGAAVVALGEYSNAVFTNNERWQKEVMTAAERAGERMWPMPLYEEHSELMKGDTAQLRNAAPHRWGGACTAAAFLKEFIEDTPWVHIDIAPTAFPSPESSIQPRKTATGSAVSTLLELTLGC